MSILPGRGLDSPPKTLLRKTLLLERHLLWDLTKSFSISVTADRGREDIGNREEFQFTFIFWEKVDHVKFFDFLCEQIFFVHEKNDGGVVEPWVGDDGLEQQNTFFHTTLKTRNEKIISI